VKKLRVKVVHGEKWLRTTALNVNYDAPYLGPEGGRPGRPTLAVRHTCSGNLGIVKILRYIRSGMHTASATNSKLLQGLICPKSGTGLKKNKMLPC
jgi:hypothetical protein